MSRKAFRSSLYGLFVSLAILWPLISILYFVTDNHLQARLPELPEVIPIALWDIHPRGVWFFGLFASILFTVHWALSFLMGKGKVALIRPANQIFTLYYFVLTFTILELINQDYYKSSIFCGEGSKRRLEFDISWPCNNAYYAEHALAFSMILIVISSLIVRVFLSRKANKK